MAPPRIAFFHIGSDTTLPTIMVRSIRANNPAARVVQCSDLESPQIAATDDVVRFVGDVSLPMRFRLECYARFSIEAPTLFLDTDMICVQPLDPVAELQGNDVAVCLRQYGNDGLINPIAMNVDLSEYSGRTWGDVYPYVGCAVASRTPDFWAACLKAMMGLPSKFQRWFGDQNAMRIVVDSNEFKIGWLPETVYACLLDVEQKPSINAKIYHFKGPERKQLMLACAGQAGLL